MKSKRNPKTKTIATLIALSLLATQNLYSMERGGNDDLNTCVDNYRNQMNADSNNLKDGNLGFSIGMTAFATAIGGFVYAIGNDPEINSKGVRIVGIGIGGVGPTLVTTELVSRSKSKGRIKEYQKIIEFIESSIAYLETNDPSQEVKLRYFLEDFGLSQFISDHDLTLMDVAEILVRIDQSGIICREEKPAGIKKLVNDFLKPNLNY